MAVQNPSMHFSVAIVGALIGIVILLFGRKLFWLCVAAVGFAAGVEIAPHLVNEPSPLLALTVALVLGLIGALLALFLQKIAIAVLGFLAGGKLAGAIAAAFFVHYAQYSARQKDEGVVLRVMNKKRGSDRAGKFAACEETEDSNGNFLKEQREQSPN